MKKALIILSITITTLLSLMGVAAFAQPVAATPDPTPLQLQLTFTKADCSQWNCTYQATNSQITWDYNTVALNTMDQGLPGGISASTFNSGWTAGSNTAVLGFGSADINPAQAPASFNATVTISYITPPPAKIQYAFTTAASSSNGLQDSSNVQHSAMFIVTTDSGAKISLIDRDFQPGIMQYLCVISSPTQSLALSSTPCIPNPTPGLIPQTLSASVLEYPARPVIDQALVTVNAYSAETTLTPTTPTDTVPVKLNLQADPTAVATVNFNTTSNDAVAAFSLQPTGDQLGSDAPVIPQLIKAGHTLQIALPSSAIITGYNVLYLDSTGVQPISSSLNTFTSGTKPAITLSDAKMPNLRVKNWPSYMAMGTLTDLSPHSIDLLMGTASAPARMTDAIFKYGENGGVNEQGIIYDPDTQTTGTITLAKNIQAKNHYDVNPVMVVYTSNLSGGDFATATKDFYGDILNDHYQSLMAVAFQLQNAPIDSVSGKGKFYGTIILNPDMLGELHKDHYSWATSINNMDIGTQLKVAVNAFCTRHNIPAPTIPSDLQSNNGTMQQYIESINWIVKTFGPNVTFAWQDNVWAGDTAAHNWLHTAVSNPSLIPTHVNSEAQFLKLMGVYGGSYSPDFIAFDKYEHDDETDGVLSAAPYYYEAPVWDVYLSYVGGVSRALNNVPVMLWQIPGGHLRTTSDVDTRKQASTGADYFVGDTSLQPGLTNLADDLKQLLGTMDSVTLFGSPDNTSLTLFQSSSICAPNALFASAAVDCQNGVLSWQQGHLNNAFHNNVFAVLWGGGQTTGIVGNDNAGGLNLDDNGWLSGRLKDYYANPIQLPTGN